MKAFPSGTQQTATEFEKPPLHEGMNLRDYFAIHCDCDDILPYLEQIHREINKDKDFIETIELSTVFEDGKYRAKARYMFADDMIKQREANK